MERSDDNGGAARKLPAVKGVKPPPLRADTAPIGSLRERIRSASAAAAAHKSTLPPPPAPAGRPSSLPPEHSGVRTRPEERVAARSASTSSLFATPSSKTMRPPPLPREATAVHRITDRASKHTQQGLGAQQLTASETSTVQSVDATTARTQAMPRVEAPASLPAPAAKSVVSGLLRASQPGTPREGRYSMRDVTAEYVEARVHAKAPPLPAAPVDVSAPEAEDLLSRSRRSTPKERPAKRRAAPTVQEHVAKVAALEQATVAQTPTLAAGLPPVVVDPQLGATTTPSLAPAPRSDRYTPLPNDRDSFEAFMRERMKDSARARPDWSDHDTQLISRDSLRPRRARGRRASWPWKLAALSIPLCVVAGSLWWVRARSDVTASASVGGDYEVQPSASGASAVTLIVTEPAGAEIVLGDAVVGNTPSEVARPKGDGLYLLRLPGFEPQLVRLTPQTREVVRVTLRPLGMPEPTPRAAGPVNVPPAQ